MAKGILAILLGCLLLAAGCQKNAGNFVSHSPTFEKLDEIGYHCPWFNVDTRLSLMKVEYEKGRYRYVLIMSKHSGKGGGTSSMVEWAADSTEKEVIK